MKRKQAESIGDILRQYLRTEGLETPLNEHRLIFNAWPEIMGKGIIAYTGNMFIKNQVLYVKITSPALRQNLQMCRTRLVTQLNEFVGSQVITSIMFN